jgi:sugar/nucleoside kinase (ribokinase family)
LAYAKLKGVITRLDLIALNDPTIELLKPILPHLDYFMPSMEEALSLSEKLTPKEAAQFFLDMGADACIFKWGDTGSYIQTSQPINESPSWWP